MRNRQGGAWRCWTVARSISSQGWVERDDLVSALSGLGVHSNTIWKWINKALEVKVFTEGKNKRLHYVSLSMAAFLFGSQYIYNPIELSSPERLFKKGWRGVLWGCFIASFDREAPISRESLKDITGICASTQINYERVGLVEAIPCWINRGKSHYRRYHDNRYFTTKDGREIERLPNVYTEKIDSGIRKTRKGSLGKERAKLKRSLAGSTGNVQRVELQELTRFYYKSLDGAVSACNRDQDEKYMWLRNSKGINWYAAISC